MLHSVMAGNGAPPAANSIVVFFEYLKYVARTLVSWKANKAHADRKTITHATRFSGFFVRMTRPNPCMLVFWAKCSKCFLNDMLGLVTDLYYGQCRNSLKERA